MPRAHATALATSIMGGMPGTDPSTLSNLITDNPWSAATADANGVSAWAGGQTWSQGTNDNKPAKSGGIVFDGTNDFLTGPMQSTIVGSAYTQFIALACDSIGTDDSDPWMNESPIQDSGQWVGLSFRSSNVIEAFHFDDTTKKASASVTTVGNHVIAWKWTGTVLWLKVDGEAWTSVSTNAPDQLGFNHIMSSSGFPFDGTIYHYSATSDAKADAEAESVLTWMNASYGLGIAL